MKRPSFLGILFVCAVAFAVARADDPGRHVPKPAGEPNAIDSSFEQLKRLAGEWEIASPTGGAQKGKVQARYHVTAGGSAVVETVFPGQAMEMVTVYHRDLDQIMLTHYCDLSNQPRMRTTKVGSASDLVFDFVDGVNIDPARDTYMHNMRMRFVDANHVRVEWQLYRDGKAAERHDVDLVRKK